MLMIKQLMDFPLRLSKMYVFTYTYTFIFVSLFILFFMGNNGHSLNVIYRSKLHKTKQTANIQENIFNECTYKRFVFKAHNLGSTKYV